MEQHNIYSEDRETVITFPTVNARIQFYPSDSKSWRGLSDIVFVCVDEFVWFEESDNPRATLDTYSIKNGYATIPLITTPGRPIGFAHKLFSESYETKQLYKILELPYTLGIGTMYTQQQIDLLKRTSLSFASEYELRWGGGGVGNTFRLEDIERCTSFSYNPDEYSEDGTNTTMAIDPSWGSSNSAIICTRLVGDKVYVIFCKEYERITFEAVTVKQ